MFIDFTEFEKIIVTNGHFNSLINGKRSYIDFGLSSLLITFSKEKWVNVYNINSIYKLKNSFIINFNRLTILEGTFIIKLIDNKL